MGLPDVSSVVKGIFTKAVNPVDLFANKTTGSGPISTTAPEHPPQHRESSNPDILDAKSGSNGLWKTRPQPKKNHLNGSFPGAHFQGSTPLSYTVGADDYFSIERPAGSPTLGERIPPPSQAALSAKLTFHLSPERQRIVNDADPNHQLIIMTILGSPDFTEPFNIPAEKLQVFYTSVPHERSEGDKQGSRGGAAGYICRWHACPQAARMYKRRDHMLSHIRRHFDVKPFPHGDNLPRCAARFLRADDLKRHVPTVHSTSLTGQQLNVPVPSLPTGYRGMQLLLGDTPRKSQIETQIQQLLTLDLNGERVTQYAYIHVPQSASVKRYKMPPKDVPPSAILRLEALAIPSSCPTVQAFCCRTCYAREAKGKPEAYPETLPQNLSPIDFACNEYLEFNSGSTIIPFRILCYSRHHSEREGFSVRLVLRNWQGDVVAAVQTPPIKITNDTPVHYKRALLPTPKARPAVELKVAAKECDVLLEISQDEMLATLNFQDGAHGADETFFSGKKKTRRSRHKPRPHLYMDYDPLNLLNLLIAGMGSWLNQSILLTNHYLLLSHSIMQALVSSGGLSTSHIPPFTRNPF